MKRSPIRKTVLVCLIACFFCSALGCEKIDLSGKKDTDSSSQSDSRAQNELIVKTTVAGSDAFYPQVAGASENERLIARFEQVERETGIRISVEATNESDLNSKFLRAARAGKFYADIIQTSADSISLFAENGFLQSAQQAGITDFSAGALKQGDTVYGFRSAAWNNPAPTVSYLLYYNRAILESGGCEDPLELYEQGVWNRAQFDEICEKIRKIDGVSLFAWGSNDATDLMWAVLSASGATFFDNDGVCVMDNETTRFGFETLKTLLRSGGILSTGDEQRNEEMTAFSAFANRKTAFFVGNSSYLFDTGDESLSSRLGTDLAIAPFPELKTGSTTAAFTEQDIFCALTDRADTNLCKRVLPLLLQEREDDGDAIEKLADTVFSDPSIETAYRTLLISANADTKLGFHDKREEIETYFLQIANGASAKATLENLQSIVNAANQKG